MQKFAAVAIVIAFLAAAPSLAQPGLGQEVDEAEVEKGETEISARFDTLLGKASGGDDALQVEVGHGFSDRFRAEVQGEFTQENASDRRLDSIAMQGIYEVGEAGGFTFALLGQYELAVDETDAVETKLLIQRKSDRSDLRLNLVASKELDESRVNFGYAASAQFAVIDDLSLGVEGFGEFRSADGSSGTEHFVGPTTRLSTERFGPELELEAGYLFALGAAKRAADRQLRLALNVTF